MRVLSPDSRVAVAALSGVDRSLTWREASSERFSGDVVERTFEVLIQKLRLQRGWSQEQLAEVSGLSARTIQRIEKGQSASLETLKALAAAFEVEVSTLQESPMSNVETAAPAYAEEALALAHVRKLKGFYEHVAVYAVVTSFLVIANLTFARGFPWSVFPALGWGGGLALHGLRVFDRVPWLTADWERRAVERRLGRKL
jgi:transcriptional regulator with XRE-family HTH domain